MFYSLDYIYIHIDVSLGFVKQKLCHACIGAAGSESFVACTSVDDVAKSTCFEHTFLCGETHVLKRISLW